MTPVGGRNISQLLIAISMSLQVEISAEREAWGAEGSLRRRMVRKGFHEEVTFEPTEE